MVIAQLYHNSNSYVCREIIAKQSVSFISDSVPLLLVVVFHLSSIKELDDFCKQDSLLYEFKTTHAVVEPINEEILKENVNEIMAELVKLKEDTKNNAIPENADLSVSTHQQLALINYCLSHLNIKKLNIELWENIGDKFCK